MVEGDVSGWLVAGGQVSHLFLTDIEQSFKMIGENPWRLVKEEENEIQPE